MRLDPWDVAIVYFPFVDIAVRKPRPVLALSDPALNDQTDWTTVAMITSGRLEAVLHDVPIIDLKSAGLKRSSVVRWKLHSIDSSAIDKRIGALSDIDRQAVLAAAKLALPLTSSSP